MKPEKPFFHEDLREELFSNIAFTIFKERYLALKEKLTHHEYYQFTHAGADSAIGEEAQRRTFNRAYRDSIERYADDSTRLGDSTESKESILESHNFKREAGKPNHGYQVSNFEMEAILLNRPSTANLDIIRLLRQGTIVDSKKVSSSDIESAYTQLFDYIEKRSKVEEPKAWLDSLCQIGIIESQIMPFFLFDVALHMEKYSEIDMMPLLPVLCAKSGRLYNFFVHIRNRYIDTLLNWKLPDATQVYHDFQNLLKIENGMLAFLKQNGDASCISESLCTDSINVAYQYFHRNYNLFEDYIPLRTELIKLREENRFSKFIKNYRTVVGELTHDGQMYVENHVKDWEKKENEKLRNC